MEGESRFFPHLSVSCCQWMFCGIAESAGKVPETRTWIFGPEDQEEFPVIHYARTGAGFGIPPILLTAVMTSARGNLAKFCSAAHAEPDQRHCHIFAHSLVSSDIDCQQAPHTAATPC